MPVTGAERSDFPPGDAARHAAKTFGPISPPRRLVAVER